MKKNWNLKQVERFMSYLSNMGWEYEEISEGSLGYGHRRFTKQGHKTVEIIEYFRNEWASGHVVKTLNPYDVTNIEWDGEEEEISHLPTEMIVHVPNKMDDDFEVFDFISETLSNLFGFCHMGFSTKPELNE